MQIDIPEAEQWLRVQHVNINGRRIARVFIGDAVVYDHPLKESVNPWDFDDEQAQAMTAFGKMLVGVLSRAETHPDDVPSSRLKIGD